MSGSVRTYTAAVADLKSFVLESEYMSFTEATHLILVSLGPFITEAIKTITGF